MNVLYRRRRGAAPKSSISQVLPRRHKMASQTAHMVDLARAPELGVLHNLAVLVPAGQSLVVWRWYAHGGRLLRCTYNERGGRQQR